MNNKKIKELTIDVKDKIRAYYEAKFRIVNTDKWIKNHRARTCNPRSVNFEGTQCELNPYAFQEKLNEYADYITLLEQKREDAEHYRDWFEPFWLELTEKEQELLAMYQNGTTDKTIVRELAIRYDVSERQIERLRDQALERLRLLLYGL